MSVRREYWGSKLGVILAVAGSAVGLGNFLRFPAKAVLNGGGAFMIPYFVAFLLLGIPLMWVEWTLGRMGGQRGHGTAPGIFDKLDGTGGWAKYLGIIGILGPFVILIYYMYIESWTLAYAWYSFSGQLFQSGGQGYLKAFLALHQGLAGEGAGRWAPALFFFGVTFAVNFFFVFRGLKGGIEKLSRYGMPLLLILAVILVAKVLTLGSPDPLRPDLSVWNGLGFIWNPDFSQLTSAKVWIEAAGQIFFTLSVGIGVILTYASYLRKSDDVTLSGLSASATNEFCEVILGGSIVIPAAFVFLGGASGALGAAQGGLFNLGFVTMPMIFGKMPAGILFSGLWFLLLFIAGITSSVSLIQPAVSFLEDELKWSRQRSATVLGAVALLACLPAIFFLGHGFVDELDFWGGTLFLVVFATIEIILFSWFYGLERGWKEMHQGAQLQVPGIYRPILKYVTPLYLLVLLAVWSYQQFWPFIAMQGVAPADRPYQWAARILIFGLGLLLAFLVARVWGRRRSA